MTQATEITILLFQQRITINNNNINNSIKNETPTTSPLPNEDDYNLSIIFNSQRSNNQALPNIQMVYSYNEKSDNEKGIFYTEEV